MKITKSYNIDWYCFYHLIKNRLVALLKALFANESCRLMNFLSERMITCRIFVVENAIPLVNTLGTGGKVLLFLRLFRILFRQNP